MVGRIDGTAGIGIFQPGAADILVLFRNDEGDTHFLQADGETQGGGAGTGDDRFEPLGRYAITAPMDRSGVFRCKLSFLGQQRDAVGENGLADAGAHHALPGVG